MINAIVSYVQKETTTVQMSWKKKHIKNDVSPLLPKLLRNKIASKNCLQDNKMPIININFPSVPSTY